MRTQVLKWVTVAEAGPPHTDTETVFVGRNSAGYCGCFNHLMSLSRRECWYLSAEGNTLVMSDLSEWARLSP